jgi:hypothetical protein
MPRPTSSRNFGRSTFAALAAAAAVLLALLIVASEVHAQGSKAKTQGAVDAGHDRLVISSMPERKRPIRDLFNRMVGKSKLLTKMRRRFLAMSESEVWSVPPKESGRLSERLKKLGMKVTKLGADWNHLLKRRSGPIAAADEAVLAPMRSAPETVGIHVMTAPEAAVAEYVLGGAAAGGEAPPSIVINLDDKRDVTVRRTRYAATAGGVTWGGVVEETGESAVLMLWKDGRLTGVLGYKGHIYAVHNMNGEAHAVIEYDPKKMPPDHAKVSDSVRDLARRSDVVSAQPAQPATALPAVKELKEADRRALEGKDITIDVMILYTKKVMSLYIRDPADLTALVIEQANETFRNSGVGNVKLRLVHHQMVDYDESGGEHFNHLYRMVDGEGPFKAIHKLRNEKRADIVGMVIDDPSGCGLSTRVGADAEEAFFVVHHSCAAITISIAHEIGHILGTRHDRHVDANERPFPYGHGYVNGKKWRDIMSYQQSCEGCVRIPFWSNPRVKYQGEATGTVANDNARVILEQAERVSKFR